MRIVVADDEPDMRDYLRAVLAHLGHEVLAIAENGADLVQLCRDDCPDLVITDINMPKVTGDEAIRQIWDFSDVAVILVSAYPFPESLSDAASRHPFCYLNKPINRTKLKEALNDLTSRST